MRVRSGMIAGLLMVLVAGAQAGDWPAFRGPAGNGISNEKNVPVTWGPKNKIKWKTELPGPANSSPIVSAGRVFVTCATDRGGQRSLYCFDRNSGKQLWVKSVSYESGKPTHQSNPYCGSTPVADGKRVVVWHGSAGLHCYNFEGEKLWSKDLGTVGHMWGYGSSPIVYNGMVLLHFGPGLNTFLTAVNLESGAVIWKTDEPGGANDRSGRMVGSWSTPIVAKVGGKDQIICSMPTRVVAYEPKTGSIIWTCDGLPSPRGDLVYTSALVGGGIGVAMGGYKGPSIGFKLGGSGNVTETNRLWRQTKDQPQRIGSGVIIGEHIFMVNAGPGTAQCLELETGKLLWQNRLSGNNWGSLIFVDGRLYVTSQNGTTTVFRPNPNKFELVAANKLGEPTNATPAFSDGQIFIRTSKHLFCIEN